MDISFSPEEKGMFTMFYTGLGISPKGVQGLAQARMLHGIFSKLEVIAESDYTNGEVTYFLVAEGGQVELTEAELRFSKDLLDEVQWRGRGVKDVIGLYEKLGFKE